MLPLLAVAHATRALARLERWSGAPFRPLQRCLAAAALFAAALVLSFVLEYAIGRDDDDALGGGGGDDGAATVSPSAAPSAEPEWDADSWSCYWQVKNAS